MAHRFLGFPHDFVWGCATAAYQIEGAAHEGGRSPSISDTYCRTPGNILDGSTGDVATDHYWLVERDSLRSAGSGRPLACHSVSAVRRTRNLAVPGSGTTRSFTRPPMARSGRHASGYPSHTPNHNDIRLADHCHRYREDVDRMSWRGLDAYRFSVAWPRVIPDGKGRVNGAGLDFYDRLVDCLLERGIAPWATLYHWDLPQALEDEGGWPERSTAACFERYARVVGERLGDRVKHWMTFNEPLAFVPLGYWMGIHAPGRKESLAVMAKAAHNVMLAHGLGVRALRQACKSPVQVGMAFNPTCTWPATDSPEDKEAAERAWMCMNGWWTCPMFEGRYPAEVLAVLGAEAPEVRPGDMEIISTPTDFLGVNVCFRTILRPSGLSPFGFVQVQPPADAPRTEMGWEVWPPVIYHTLRQLEDHHPGKTYYQTESGAAFADEVGEDGKVHDPRRVQYLRDHLAQARRAIQDGIGLRGHFVWTLMDNFEWTYGCSKRFGLWYTDFGTLERIPKDSAYFYRDVIERNGVMVQDDAPVS